MMTKRMAKCQHLQLNCDSEIAVPIFMWFKLTGNRARRLKDVIPVLRNHKFVDTLKARTKTLFYFTALQYSLCLVCKSKYTHT